VAESALRLANELLASKPNLPRNLAASRRLQAEDGLSHHALAAARLAYDRQRATMLERDAHPVNGGCHTLARDKRDRQILDLQEMRRTGIGTLVPMLGGR
jgi:hypothetical protein